MIHQDYHIWTKILFWIEGNQPYICKQTFLQYTSSCPPFCSFGVLLIVYLPHFPFTSTSTSPQRLGNSRRITRGRHDQLTSVASVESVGSVAFFGHFEIPNLHRTTSLRADHVTLCQSATMIDSRRKVKLCDPFKFKSWLTFQVPILLLFVCNYNHMAKPFISYWRFGIW